MGVIILKPPMDWFCWENLHRKPWMFPFSDHGALRCQFSQTKTNLLNQPKIHARLVCKEALAVPTHLENDLVFEKLGISNMTMLQNTTNPSPSYQKVVY